MGINEKKQNASKIFIITGLLGIIVFLFTGFSLFKIYEKAYTTTIKCSKDDYMCTIKKIDIFGKETIQNKFAERKLTSVEIIKKKNILQEEVYYLVINDIGDNNQSFFITEESPEIDEQQENLNEIKEYLNFYRREVEFENPRNKFKYLGFSVTGVGCIIALLLVLDSITGLINYNKNKKKNRLNAF